MLSLVLIALITKIITKSQKRLKKKRGSSFLFPDGKHNDNQKTPEKLEDGVDNKEEMAG